MIPDATHPQPQSVVSRPADDAEIAHRQERTAHWNAVSDEYATRRRPGESYRRWVQRYFRFLAPPGLSVLEVGCAHGDLLAALQPSRGVGIDLSPRMIEAARRRHPGLTFLCQDAHDLSLQDTFDVIVLSDLVGDLWDIQRVLDRLRPCCHPRTRVILNFYNNLWKAPLGAVRRLGLATPLLPQNWVAPEDMLNFLRLSGFETVRRLTAILLPLRAPGLSFLCNRILAYLWPFRLFALTHFLVARPAGPVPAAAAPSVSIVIAARNEAGNVERIFREVPDMGSRTELVFVEGHSRDNTYEAIERCRTAFPHRPSLLLRQTGVGKGDAIRLGMDKASGDVLIVYDADRTVPPADLPRFYDVLVSGNGEFANGVRLIYPMEEQSMQFLNMVGNKFFSLAFTWLLGCSIKDTLCGTKALWKRDYALIAAHRGYFGDFDPFGDFDLLFGAAKLSLGIVEIPVRYRSRQYGTTNIRRWRHGWLLLRMTWIAARRLKFV